MAWFRHVELSQVLNTDKGSIISSPVLTDVQIEALYNVAQRASELILTIYRDESLWQAKSKSDETPVTAADILSSDLLVEQLPKILNCPVVSEEDLPPYHQRQKWSVYWLIDPMDGTREFLHHSGEFVINIALMVDHQPVFGMIYQPTTQQCWWGGKTYGAFFGQPTDATELKPASCNDTIVALGSRRSKWQGAWLKRLEVAGKTVITESVGSALKFARLAENNGDIYPRLGPTCEWDTAAPQAILDATGGAIVQWNGEPLRYGKEDVLNPYFVAVKNIELLPLVLEKKIELGV